MLQQRRTAAKKNSRHGSDVQAALRDGREQAFGVAFRFLINDFFRVLVHMAGIAAQNAFNLRCRHRQAKAAADLLADLIQAADHPKFQTAAGGGVGDAVVQPHEIHRPAADIRNDDGWLIQQATLRQRCGIALRIQRHFGDRDDIVLSFIAEGHRFTAPAQVVPERFLIPAASSFATAASVRR